MVNWYVPTNCFKAKLVGKKGFLRTYFFYISQKSLKLRGFTFFLSSTFICELIVIKFSMNAKIMKM